MEGWRCRVLLHSHLHHHARYSPGICARCKLHNVSPAYRPLTVNQSCRKFPRNFTCRSSSCRVSTNLANWSSSTLCPSCGAPKWSFASSTLRTCHDYGPTTLITQWVSCTSSTSSFSYLITCTCCPSCTSRRSRRMSSPRRWSILLLARLLLDSSTSSPTVASQLCCWHFTTSANSLLTPLACWKCLTRTKNTWNVSLRN